ncbi:uncharacterized protein MKZ38_000841 [Zalerion maritima]|uniref:Derlin n=1 Tax=Zalerion maritima TaxID=339359 RepID=A0AAD5S5K6_9PEZI|nr:uncharacterized protein MKZ38_000841 [Zalerion maritima]
MGLVSPYLFAWLPARLFTRRNPELKQLFTLFSNFLITGPKIGMVMDPYWLYKWSFDLETHATKFPKREDYIWYLSFVGGIIHIINYYFVGSPFLLSGLELALCYTACQDARGQQQGLFFFQIPAQMMPLAMIALTALMTGSIEATYVQFAGLVAAHLYDFLHRIFPEFGGGPNLIPTPSWVSWICGTPRVLQQGFGTATRQPDQAEGRTTGSRAGGPLPDSWRTRGTGHRLGGS